MDEVIKQFAGELKKLSPRLQEFILRGDWEDKLAAIGTRYNLAVDQIYDLKIKVALVLFGLESPADFESNVRQALPLPTISQIIADSQREVFGEINDELTKMNAELESRERLLDEKYAALPENTRDMLTAPETNSKILDIGKKYNLHVDQTGELADEIGLMLLGITPSSLFANHLQTRLKVEANVAQTIAADVSQQIFLPIRQSMQQPSIVEQKMSGVFNLPTKPAVDPYLEPPA